MKLKKVIKIISAEVKAHLKQQDKKELWIRSTLKYNAKLACISHLLLLGIP